MLVIAKSRHQASGIADVRQQLTANATSIDYATRLWQVFRAVIAGALDELNVLLGDMANQVMETIVRLCAQIYADFNRRSQTIERHVQSFFVQALQLDARTLRLEAK